MNKLLPILALLLLTGCMNDGPELVRRKEVFPDRRIEINDKGNTNQNIYRILTAKCDGDGCEYHECDVSRERYEKLAVGDRYICNRRARYE